MLNFVPPLFLVYLVAEGIILLAVPRIGYLLLLPLGVYGLAVFVQACVLSASGQILRSLAAIPLIVLTHVLYGFGFWRGLFTALKVGTDRQSVPVELEVVPIGEEKPG